MSFHKVAIFAAAAGLVTAAASAQDRGRRFVERDLNRDGVLSQEEYTSTGGHPGNFRALDVNNDGVLSRGEFVNRTGAIEDDAVVNPDAQVLGGVTSRVPAYTPSAAGPEFDKLDTNRDRILSRAEWYGDGRVFGRMDTNDDGLVTTSEYVVYQDARGDGVLRKDDPYYDTGAYGYPDDRLVKDSQRRFEVYDRNDDGVVSRREWTGDLGSFSVLDRNRDGRLSFSEFRDTRVLEDRFIQLDRNRDGAIDRREWLGTASSFRTLDRDRDGRLTRGEYLL
jgi:Ca2+-binding EF-hand superfamily protein